MKFLFAFIFFVVSIFFSFTLGSREWQPAFIGLATIVGFLLGHSISLSKRLSQLQQSLSDDWEQRNLEKQQALLDDNSTPVPSDTNSNGITADTSSEQVVENTASIDEQVERKSVAQNISKESAVNLVQNAQKDTQKTAEQASQKASINDEPRELSIFDVIGNVVKGYFTSGNIFVRIGIIILFFGVSFLLKYVSDRGMFPIEYRLIGVVIGAIFLLGVGWRLRHKNETYALLLQGAGIGILYLDIYAAYNLYQLIPSLAAFALLFVVSMFSAALAVLQDSKSLAVLGFSGGFLAPILASSGANNHVGLFSYYAVLNTAIVAVAWFKAWRELNLLGFAFTFIIGTAWGILSYNTDKFSTTEPFLILFFVFYVLIAVLYALRQPPKLKGYVDGTLLFGVPLAASALQYSLVKNIEYGVSLSSFAMGAFYLFMAWFIWNRKGTGLKLLAEAFLALGVIFASMAIPFALAPTQTAAAWALEGAGFIWLGSRQNRLSVRGFGVLLQIAAGIIFLVRYQYEPDAKPFINGEFISAMMLAVAGLLSARLLFKPSVDQKTLIEKIERIISPALLLWGLAWLIGGFGAQMSDHYSDKLIPSAMLLLIAVVSLILGVIATRIKPLWKDALVAAFALSAVIILMGIAQFVISVFSFKNEYHPAMWNGWLAWPIVFITYYYLLSLLQKLNLFPRFQKFFHSALLLLIVLLVTFEGFWLIDNKLGLQSAWLGIWTALPATFALWLLIKAPFWPFSSHKDSYRQYTGSVLAIALAIWSFVALTDKGISDPLPWIPVLNPLDIMLGIVFITLFKWWNSLTTFNFGSVANHVQSHPLFNKKLFVMGFVALGFLWLNFTLFRVAHHWFDVPYTQYALFNSSLVQTAVSILWAFTGVCLTLFASRKNNRLLWMMGAVLLGLVVIKLFAIDFSALGSLGRVISFLVVGALLTSIGYFAPLPEKEKSDTENADEKIAVKTTSEQSSSEGEMDA